MSCLNHYMNIQVRHLLFQQHELSRLKLLFLCSVFSSTKLVHVCTGKMRVTTDERVHDWVDTFLALLSLCA